MNRRIFLCAALACAFVLGSTSIPATSLASSVKQHASPCGALSGAHTLVEPPDVDVWTLPKDAGGERELLLAVHRSGDQFCYTYAGGNGTQTQAPVIRVKRGERFALRVVNDISGPSKGEHVASTALAQCMPMRMPAAPVHHYVGYLNHTIDDRYRSAAPLDTNIHLHGFEGPASQEDVFLSTLSTPMHACEYHITIPRTQPPGTYFYHPHIHGATFDQVAGGLDGVWIVEPDGTPIPRSLEHVVVLRYRYPYQPDNAYAPDEDPLLAAAGEHINTLRPAAPVAYNPFDPPPWPVSYPMRAGGVSLDASGCNGVGPEDLITANGTSTPATLDVPAGQTQLYRIVNGTTDATKPLQLRDSAGKPVALKVVARDGVPISGDDDHPLAQYVATSQVMLVPSGRADLLIAVPEGQTYTLSSEHFCGGKDYFFQLHHDLLRIHGVVDSTSSGSGIAAVPVRIADSPAAKLVAYVRAHPSSVHRRRAITFSEYFFGRNGKIPAHYGYYITDTTNPKFHEHPFWPVYLRGGTVPANPDIVVKAGTIEEWYLINTTMETHVFHIHQMAFVEEKSRAGVPMTVDDAFVPIGTLLANPSDPNYPLVQPSITKVILDFRHVPRGTFVFHCHMLFHEDAGMMGTVRVE